MCGQNLYQKTEEFDFRVKKGWRGRNQERDSVKSFHRGQFCFRAGGKVTWGGGGGGLAEDNRL